MQGQCFMTLVHLWVTMFHVNVLEKSFGKVNPLPSAHFMRVGLFPFFTFLAGLECSYVKKNPNQTIYEANSGEIESNREIWGTFSATSVQEKLT